MTVAAEDRILTMDVERSKIRLAVCMICSLDGARCQFFAAPVGARRRPPPSRGHSLMSWTGLRGPSPLERRVKSTKLERSKYKTKIPYFSAVLVLKVIRNEPKSRIPLQQGKEESGCAVIS